MIRDTIVAFLARTSDYIFSGRNRARIVVGTDRKDTADSGYGAGGQDDPDSSTIDIVVGFDPTSGDPDLENDKSRIYLSEKTDPDDYFNIQVGDSVTGESAGVVISDHIRVIGRKTIKIVGKDFSINIDDQGNATIKANKVVFDSSDTRLGGDSVSEKPTRASKILQELQSIDRTLKSLTVTGTATGTFTIPYNAPLTDDNLGATKTKID